MPRVGPGGDNVTGDRYTLDLGVEPDLGNLLQNLQIANDYLDQAEQRFRTISDVVGTTTQRLAQATRQTQMLAAETQRLQNSYAQIASSTMGVANMGMGGMMGGGMPMGGMAGYGYPGQMSFSGMGSPGGGNTIQTMPSSVVRDQNAGGFEGGQSTVAPQRMAGMTTLRAEQTVELARNIRGWYQKYAERIPSGSKMGEAIRKVELGYAAKQSGNALAMKALGSEGLGRFGAMGATAMRFAPTVAGAAGAIGGGLYVANKVYDVWANQQAEARQLAGITGGEAGVAGMFGNNRIPGSIGLNWRARLMGFMNPGVDYGEIQQRALGAGYVEGLGYEQTRDYLFEAYKRGLGTTVDQIDLYTEAVDKSGASTGQLVQSMDQLRAVASNTNVSIGALYGNMKAQLETLTGMGMTGGAALAQATQGSVAYANSRLASLDPNLRQAGGYSITSPFMQARVAGNLGIPIGGMASYISAHPGMNVNVQGENAARDTLINMLGFRPEWTNEPGGPYDQYIASRGWGAFNADGTTILGSILTQLGILPQNLDPGEITSIKRWIFSTINERPMRDQAAAARRAMGGVRIASGSGSASSRMDRLGSEISGGWSANYEAGYAAGSDVPIIRAIPGLKQAAGWLTGGIAGGLSGIVEGAQGILNYDESMQSQYMDKLGVDPMSEMGLVLGKHFQETQKTSPILEQLLKRDPNLTNTYVKLPNGRIIRGDEWVKNAPDWQNALSSGRVQIAHANSAVQAALGGAKGSEALAHSDVVASGNLTFNTAEDELGAAGKRINGTRSRGWNADNLFGLDDRTILRLAGAIGKEVAENT